MYVVFFKGEKSDDYREKETWRKMQIITLKKIKIEYFTVWTDIIQQHPQKLSNINNVDVAHATPAQLRTEKKEPETKLQQTAEDKKLVFAHNELEIDETESKITK